MINRALVVLFLAPGLAHAVICKTVDAEGVVAYEDLPANECRTPIRLPEYSRYAPRVIRQPGTADNAAISARELRFEGYASLRIMQPVASEEILSDGGKVPLTIVPEPALQPGHRISVYLDDALIPGSFDGPAIELTGVDLGPHRVRAAVFDAAGKRVIDSAAIQFMLREAGQVDESPPTAPPPDTQ